MANVDPGRKWVILPKVVQSPSELDPVGSPLTGAHPSKVVLGRRSLGCKTQSKKAYDSQFLGLPSRRLPGALASPRLAPGLLPPRQGLVCPRGACNFTVRTKDARTRGRWPGISPAGQPAPGSRRFLSPLTQGLPLAGVPICPFFFLVCVCGFTHPFFGP